MDKLNRRQLIEKGAIAVVVTSTGLCYLTGCSAITKVGDTAAINPASYTLKEDILTIDLAKEIL